MKDSQCPRFVVMFRKPSAIRRRRVDKIESIRLEPVPFLVPRNMRIEAIKAVGQSIQRRDTPV